MYLESYLHWRGSMRSFYGATIIPAKTESCSICVLAWGLACSYIINGRSAFRQTKRWLPAGLDLIYINLRGFLGTGVIKTGDFLKGTGAPKPQDWD